jgi:hypothetical protein
MAAVAMEPLLRELSLVEIQLITMRARKEAVEERISQPKIPVEVLLQMNPEFNTLRDQREALQQQRDHHMEGLDNTVALERLDQSIERVTERIQKIASDTEDGGIRKILDELVLQEQMTLFHITQEIRTQEILLEKLTQQYREQQTRSMVNAENILDISFDQSQLTRTNKIIDQIDDRIMAIQSQQRAPSRISQLSQAVPSAPNTLKSFAMAGLGALVVFFSTLFVGIAVDCLRFCFVMRIRNVYE